MAFLDTAAPVLLVFHMDGCPHCRVFQGDDNILQAMTSDLHIIRCESKDPLTRAIGITSFPTVLLALPEIVLEYQGAREPAAMDAALTPYL